MTPAFLVEQLECQQRQQGAGGGDHLRAGIPGRGDEAIEAETGQERQEEEDAHEARVERAAGGQVQLPGVGDLGLFRSGAASARRCPAGPSAAVGAKKGGVTPPRRSARKRLTIDWSVETLKPNRTATGSSGWPSTNTARRASYCRWKVCWGSMKNCLSRHPSITRSPYF